MSIVRLKKGGKRFERVQLLSRMTRGSDLVQIACYQNKVTEFRTGV